MKRGPIVPGEPCYTGSTAGVIEERVLLVVSFNCGRKRLRTVCLVPRARHWPSA